MPKFSGINRAYASGDIEKTPQETRRKDETVLSQRWQSRKSEST